MKRTNRLGLPIFDNPNTDRFGLDEWNYANETIDEAYDEIDNIRKEIPKVNASAEVLEARMGKESLGDKMKEVSSQLETKADKGNLTLIKSQVDNLVLESGGDSNLEVVQARTTKRGITVKTLSSNINGIYDMLTNGVESYSIGDWVQGAMTADGLENGLATFIKTTNYITFYKGDKVKFITPTGYALRVDRVIDGTRFISDFRSKDINYYCDKDTKFRFCIRNEDSTSVITPGEGELLILEIERKIKINKEDCSFINSNPFLSDKTNVEYNKVLNAGITEDSNVYCVTPYIPFLPNQELYISDYRNYHIYGRNYVPIGGDTTEVTSKTKFTINADIYTNVRYIRFTVRKSTIDNFYASYEDFGDTDRKESGFFLNGLKVSHENLSKELEEYIKSIEKSTLSGKKILSFGDSIFQGASGTVAPVKAIADKYLMNFTNYAQGGATMTEVAVEGNNLHTQLTRSASQTGVDYVVFNGMTNDINNTTTAPIGSITTGYGGTFDKTTFSGAFESFIKTVRERWTSAKILYVRPHNMSSRNSDNQISYGERAKDICKKWSIPFVDLYNECGLNSNIETIRDLYTNHTYTEGKGDATHPNNLGYELFYVPQIEAKLKTL